MANAPGCRSSVVSHHSSCSTVSQEEPAGDSGVECCHNEPAGSSSSSSSGTESSGEDFPLKPNGAKIESIVPVLGVLTKDVYFLLNHTDMNHMEDDTSRINWQVSGGEGVNEV